MVQLLLACAQLHHAGGDTDSAPREHRQHVHGGLCACGICVERIVDDGDAARAANELQAMLHRLKLAHTRAQLLFRKAKVQRDRRTKHRVLDVVAAEQRNGAGNCALRRDQIKGRTLRADRDVLCVNGALGIQSG